MKSKNICTIFLASIFLIGTAQSHAKIYHSYIDGSKTLPSGWKLHKTMVFGAQQTSQIGKKLGGYIEKLSNSFLSFHGKGIKINIVDCRTVFDAKKIYKTMLRIHGGNKSLVLLDAKTVVEFTRISDFRVLFHAYYDLGFKAKKVSYQITFEAIPIKKCNYMRWNQMFNLFLKHNKGYKVENQIAKLSSSFDYSNEIYLRKQGLGNYQNTYHISPKKYTTSSKADLNKYSFDFLPKKVGLPNMRLKAYITSEAFAIVPTSRKADQTLLGATTFWPSSDPQIKVLAKKIIGRSTTAEHKVQSLLQWLLPGRNIVYKSKTLGSRYGVKKVLEQKFGLCWDFSDCFITLCRASGVPARQVGGWLYGQSGHVWAEVLLEGHGWLQVDPTMGMRCTSDHIPYITTENGNWPFVYTTMVKIKRLK